jgi:hypothetical protein
MRHVGPQSSVFQGVCFQMKTQKSHSKSSKSVAGLVFDSIRKPLAPPGQPMSHAKPDAKARPAGRKAKHKQRPETEIDE